ncbi:MAG TPA: class I SAM-dependent methyltransferase [Acidimicrobiales bacterium]|jgi:ubiquinone/menaquinone biosynthesis C-methylase UbiE|nr:class I SAM-dependent methyltransferase [Acidimicrobiales bacterium]
MSSDWWLDEMAHAGPEHLDPEFVAGYDRKQAMDFGPEVELLRARGLTSQSTVVDLAAGSGGLTLAVAPHCKRVVAVDISPAMTALIRRQSLAQGAENIEVVESGLLTYEHEGSRPDFVYCRNALHQLPDFWKVTALDRIAAMLPAGGALRLVDLVFDAEPADLGDVVAAWLEGAAVDAVAGYTRADFAVHLRTEFSTFRWLLEPMLSRAGFEIVEAEYRRRVYGSYVCVRV